MPESYRSIIETISRTKSSPLTVFIDFCRMAACALAAGSREPEYLETIQSYGKEELHQLSRAFALLVEEAESKPFTDVLGTYYIEIASHSSKQARGEFYTPQELSRAMAKMLIDIDTVRSRGKPITVCDPCCGSGGMILALAQELAPDSVDLIRATCQDINPVAADMCYINTSLWGIPTTVILGDSLRMTTQNAWRNVHWARVGEDQRQAIEVMKDLISSPSPDQNPAPPKAGASGQPSEPLCESDGQFEFDLDLGEAGEIGR